MLSGKHSRYFQVNFKYVPRFTCRNILKYTCEHALKDAPNCTWWYTRSHICSYLGSKDALKYIPKHALKYVPNCVIWYTPSLLGFMLPSSLSRGKTLPISPDYMVPCMLLGIWSRDLQSRSHQAPGDRWWVVRSGWHIMAEIITSVNIQLWTLS